MFLAYYKWFGCVFSQAKDSLIKVELIDESDYTRLQGKIVGPPGTPFHGKWRHCGCHGRFECATYVLCPG